MLIWYKILVLIATKVNLQLREIDFVIPVLLVENEKIHHVRIVVQENLENLRRVVLTVQQDTIKIQVVQLHVYLVFRKIFLFYLIVLFLRFFFLLFSHYFLFFFHIFFIFFSLLAVNLTMMRVLVVVNYVRKMRTFLTKIEVNLVLNAQQVGCQKKVVQNVKLVVLVHMAKAVNRVQ